MESNVAYLDDHNHCRDIALYEPVLYVSDESSVEPLTELVERYEARGLEVSVEVIRSINCLTVPTPIYGLSDYHPDHELREVDRARYRGAGIGLMSLAYHHHLMAAQVMAAAQENRTLVVAGNPDRWYGEERWPETRFELPVVTNACYEEYSSISRIGTGRERDMSKIRAARRKKGKSSRRARKKQRRLAR